MNNRLFLIFLVWVLYHAATVCQPSNRLEQIIPQGLSLTSGYIHYGVKDEFISKEKYMGGSANYIIGWSKYHESYLFALQFQLVSGAEARNHTMSASITDFSLNLAYQYPIGSLDFIGRPLYLYAGPHPEFYFHFRTQNIARGGAAMIDAYSAALLLSFGGRLSGFMSLSDRLSLAADFSTSLVSLGGKFIDPREKNTSMVKFLTPFSGLKASTTVGVNYHIADYFTIGCGYRFSLVHISAWDSFLYASDNLTLSLMTTF